MNFVFYDTETTGTDTAFDQILQFAAILTDSELNEIDRFEIRCQLLPHIIPAPGALKITGVRVMQIIDSSLPTHYQMVSAIKEKLSAWSPATFIGYNSIDFDEQLLRQAFYQTLYPLYLTNSDGNCRMDMLTVAQGASLFAPDVLKIPSNDKGPTFKLDKLAPLNGFDHSNAHDAMGDVLATIHICKIVKERATDLWRNFERFSRKAEVMKFALTEPVFLLSDFYFGKSYSLFVTTIGTNPDNSSEIFAFNLGEDPNEFAKMSHDELVIRFKQTPKPVRSFKSNACPNLRPMEHCTEIERQMAIEPAEFHRRANILKSDSALCQRFVKAQLATRDEKVLSEHVEKQMYDGFFDLDKELLNSFHKLPWEERKNLILKLQDKRLKTLGLRLLYSERPDLLEEATRQQWENAVAKRLLSFEKVDWLTFPKAMEEVDELLKVSNDDEGTLLNEYRDYLLERMGKAKKLTS